MATSRAFDDLVVVALEDGEGPFFAPREQAFPDASPAQWAEADHRDPASVRDGGWWLRFRCFALRLGSGRVILVDAGIGSTTAPSRAWAPVPGQLPAQLASAGIGLGDIDTVVLTHAHTDHIGWSVGESGPTFPNARYLLQQAEIDAIDARAPGIAQWLLAPLRASGQLQPLHGDAPIGEGIRAVATPGHTPGHQSVLVDRGDETMLITGDLLVHMLQLIDPSLRYSQEHDPDLARISRTDLLARLAGRLVLATAHLGEPFLDHPLPDHGSAPVP